MGLVQFSNLDIEINRRPNPWRSLLPDTLIASLIVHRRICREPIWTDRCSVVSPILICCILSTVCIICPSSVFEWCHQNAIYGTYRYSKAVPPQTTLNTRFTSNLFRWIKCKCDLPVHRLAGIVRIPGIIQFYLTVLQTHSAVALVWFSSPPALIWVWLSTRIFSLHCWLGRDHCTRRLALQTRIRNYSTNHNTK